MIQIDGNYGEGGGAIARVALALSTIAQKPFEIYDIRKGRPQPGLKNQHLYCVRALKGLCNAAAEGDELGSTFLKYYPKKLVAKTFLYGWAMTLFINYCFYACFFCMIGIFMEKLVSTPPLYF